VHFVAFFISGYQMPTSEMNWSTLQSRLKIIAGQKRARTTKRVRETPAIDTDRFLCNLKETAPNAVVWKLIPSVYVSSSTETALSDPEFVQQSYMLQTLFSHQYQLLAPDELLLVSNRITSTLEICEEQIATVEQ